MSRAGEIKEQLTEQRDTLRRWMAVQSVLRWIFLVNLALTFYLGYSGSQGTWLTTLVVISTISFLALAGTFITTGNAASQIKKLIQQLNSLPINNREELPASESQDSTVE